MRTTILSLVSLGFAIALCVIAPRAAQAQTTTTTGTTTTTTGTTTAGTTTTTTTSGTTTDSLYAPTPPPQPTPVVAPVAAPPPPPANLSDRGGDVGVGGEALLGGVGGVNVRYYLSNDLGIQGTLRAQFGTLSADTGAGDVSTGIVAFGIGFGMHFRLVPWADGAISFATGIDFSTTNNRVEDVTSSLFEIGVGGGLQGEWFLNESFSLHGQVGMRFAFGFGDESNVRLSIGGDAFGGFGFTVWLS